MVGLFRSQSLKRISNTPKAMRNRSLRFFEGVVHSRVLHGFNPWSELILSSARYRLLVVFPPKPRQTTDIEQVSGLSLREPKILSACLDIFRGCFHWTECNTGEEWQTIA